MRDKIAEEGVKFMKQVKLQKKVTDIFYREREYPTYKSKIDAILTLIEQEQKEKCEKCKETQQCAKKEANPEKYPSHRFWKDDVE